MTDPHTVQTTTSSIQSTGTITNLHYQGVGKRFVAIVIDFIILFGVAYAIAAATGGTTEGGFELNGAPALLWFVVVIGYFVLMEARTGATVGKMVLGMRVRALDGSPITMRQSLIRNVLRIVDGLFGYLVGAIFVWTSDLKQRLGDRVAETVVVSK